MISWLFYALVVSAAVAASAIAFELAARVLKLPRRAPWAVASFALALLPLLVPLVGRLSRRAAEIGTGGDALALRLPAITIGADRATAGLPMDVLLLFVLLTVSAVALVRTAVAHARLRRESRAWPQGEMDGIPVRLSDSTGPAVSGWLHPMIVMPRWVTQLAPAQRGAILAHELEHVRANDSLLLNASRLVFALVAWNPIAWLAYRRLRLAVEIDCDRRVLALGGDMPAYAETLLAVAQRTAVRPPLLHVALTEPTTFLSRRIAAMLTKPTRSPRLIALGGMSAGALLLAVACMTREPLGTSTEKAVQQAPRVVVSADDTVRGAVAASQGGEVGERPYFEYQVEQPVTSLPGGTYPRYPDSLRTAGIEGEVLVQFVVDAEGEVDLTTFKVLKANREEFVMAVRQALPGMQFQPARKDGRAVKQVVQQSFMFKVAK